MWLAFGRVLLEPPGGSSAGRLHMLRDGIMRTASQGAPGGRRMHESALSLSDVYRTTKPPITHCSGIVSGAAYSAGIARTAQAYPRHARTGAGGARGRRAYIRTGAQFCGALGGSWAIWDGLPRSGIEKAPDGSGAGVI